MAPCFDVFAKADQWLNFGQTESLDVCGHPAVGAEDKFFLRPEKENSLSVCFLRVNADA